MSDLRYYVTAKSRGKKPIVLFLTDSLKWSRFAEKANTFNLADAKKAAKYQPTHCVFVEANDDLKNALLEEVKTEQHISTADFEYWVGCFNCKHENTVKERKQPETQAKETSEPITKGKYIVYWFVKHNNQNIVFYQGKNADIDTSVFFGKKEAGLYNLDYAILMANELKHFDAKYEEADIVISRFNEPQPTPAPEVKKRVGYVLHRELTDGCKIYRRETETIVLLNPASIADAEIADVYMTKDEADFVAYAQNKCVCNLSDWQVEQIEF